MDPVQERLRQNKALWNKEVSTFINDLIHFKKTMNGWPSKFFKERSRITSPVPADPATIIGSLAGDFQELVNKGNSVIQEQLDYSKNRRQKQPKAPAAPQQPATPGTPTAPTSEAPKPDLNQQLGQGLAASTKKSELIKLAFEFEDKYSLEAQASNPFSRFVTRLFNPKFGFGEGARIRRLRMTMLDNCVKSFKAIKQLHKEIVKSSKGSIVNAHKMMTLVWNYWNIVSRLFSAYKVIKPGEVKDPGGAIEDPELKRQRAVEEGRDPDVDIDRPTLVSPDVSIVNKLKDFRTASSYLGPVAKSPAFRELNSIVEAIVAAPKHRKPQVLQQYNVSAVYDRALQEVNSELGTSGSSFVQIVEQAKSQPAKTAQRQLGKFRHQILPGATSGSRLEVYGLIDQIRKDLDEVMNLLEAGFDQEKLAPAINQVNRQMAALRTMIRSLYYSEKPEEASSPFF
jgi:hypothetical protein